MVLEVVHIFRSLLRLERCVSSQLFPPQVGSMRHGACNASKHTDGFSNRMHFDMIGCEVCKNTFSTSLPFEWDWEKKLTKYPLLPPSLLNCVSLVQIPVPHFHHGSLEPQNGHKYQNAKGSKASDSLIQWHHFESHFLTEKVDFD